MGRWVLVLWLSLATGRLAGQESAVVAAFVLVVLTGSGPSVP